MNIGNISGKVISGVKKIGQNFQSCPIKLRQNAQDVFIKSQDPEIRKYLEKCKQNPNTAFLFNPKLSHEDKMKMLKKSDKVFKAQELTNETGVPSMYWLSEKFFDFEQYVHVDYRGKASPAVKIIDMTNPINARSYEAAKKVIKGKLDPESFRLSAGMDLDSYMRYCREGRIEKVQLPHKKTGVLTNTRLIDPKSPKNIEAANRFKALTPKNSKYYYSDSVNIVELSKLGFGTPKELAGLVKTGGLDGTIKVIGKNEKGQNIVQVMVNMNTLKSKCILQTLRDKRCISADELAKKSGIKISQLEDAILSGEMVSVDRIFEFDSKKPFFDVTNPKNIATFDRLQFEKRLEKELLEQEVQSRRDLLSLKSKLAWHLCPNTRKEASIAFAQSDIKKISAEIHKLKEALSNPELTPEEVETLEEQLIKLYQNEDIVIKKAFGAMWQNAGTDEYKAGMARAKELIAQVKTNGIDSIQDEGIKTIFKAHQG